MGQKEQTACFTGHRDIDKREFDKVSKILESVIENLIKMGVIYYGSGGAIGFDTLCAKIVVSLREKYPNIKLILILPCKNQDKLWNQKDKDIYASILKQANKIVYTSENYYENCMHKRNRHLVNYSDHCICYLNKNTGATFYTVNYAKSKGLKITNLYQFKTKK